MKKLTKEQLEELVQAYQMGDEKAAEKLLQAYQAYFQKFINLIKYGKFDISDRTLRLFLKCFLSEEERANINKWRKSNYVRSKFKERSEILQAQLSFFEEWELRSEMMIIIMDMAQNHHKDSFRSYVTGYFPLILAKRLMKIIHVELEHEKNNVRLSDNIIEVSCEDTYAFEKDESAYHIFATEPTLYDENWINGYGCSEPFADLTPYERRILKWKYEWKATAFPNPALDNRLEMDHDLYEELKELHKMTDSDIADRLGCSRKTVNLKRNDIVDRVKEIAIDHRLIKG